MFKIICNSSKINKDFKIRHSSSNKLSTFIKVNHRSIKLNKDIQINQCKDQTITNSIDQFIITCTLLTIIAILILKLIRQPIKLMIGNNKTG